MVGNTRWLLALVVAAGIGAPAWAQDPEDGPGRGVARISLINGDVSIRRGDSGDYMAAAINSPVVVQDQIVTGTSSRTELQFDWANMLRLASNAEVHLAELEYQRYIVQLARGTITWRVLRDQDAYVEISTLSVSVRPVKRGTYRITVHEDGSSEITVRSGEAEIFTPRGSERLGRGKTMVARGTAGDPEFRTIPEIPDDDWDRWNERRDRDLERTQSYNYISRDIYGAEDLDPYGRWLDIPGYGWVWSPRVAPDWAPYRHGRWSWIDWYGWSWVSYDPWGWAPYHYGRWFNHAPYGWVWYPGRIGGRHYWAPGYVAFFGFGGGVNVGWGRVGWVPLAPYEPFYPWWGSRYYRGYRGGGYFNNSVTVVNNVNITNVYRNTRFSGATVIDGDGFRRGRFGSTIRPNEANFREASLARGPVPVTPGRESLHFADREASVRGFAGRGSEHFFSNRRPAEVDKVPFEDQRREMERITQRSFQEPGSGTRSWQTAESPVTPRSERNEDPQRGWRRVGEPPRSAAPSVPPQGETEVAPAERGNRGVSSGEGEWRRFGSARVTQNAESPRTERTPAARFGEPAADAAPRTQRSTGNSGEWHRFGSGSAERVERGSRSGSEAGAPAERSGRWGNQSRMESPRSEAPRTEVPRMERSGVPERGSRFASPRSSGGESIRISPPIVRERGGGDSGNRGVMRGGDRGGGGGRSGGGRGR